MYSPASHPAAARPTEGVAALITRQSQELSDASASGDSAAFERLLDDSVVFMNETGAIATRQDLLAGPKPPQAGLRQLHGIKQLGLQDRA
jgi:hypothetical protein